MHIAVEGCSHGELDIIYRSVQHLEKMNNLKIDLLLCCGDFQSVRNEKDLKCMAVPTKFMQMHDFYRYYSGEKVAPILTIFIGGNHEASNYLQELPYGGWVAPNIYYLGYAGVVRVGDLRIGGFSGIYKGCDYLKGHFEKSPYSGSTMRSVYHIRNLEVFRLKQLSGKIDIVMSHDWPRGIYHYGNVNQLLQIKPYFAKEVQNNSLGSRPAEDLIKKLRPQYWFSGHLHVKFAALMPHEEKNGKKSLTKFLALDKCLPRREFLQVLKLPINTPKTLELSHDAEWLTILRLTNHLLSTKCRTVYMPGPGSSERYNFTPTPEEIEETISLMGGDLSIAASNFVQTATPFSSERGLPNMKYVSMPQPFVNPQTTNLCSQLGIDDPLGKETRPFGNSFRSNSSFDLDISSSVPFNKSEMNITVDSLQTTNDSINQSRNPEEVELSDENEFEICKDEESGDYIMHIPLASSFNSSKGGSPKINVSPIGGDKLSTPSRETFSSPYSSSPRLPFENLPRKSLSLSKCKGGNDSVDFSISEPRPTEEERITNSSTTSPPRTESSPSSLSSELLPLSVSSQSEEDESDALKKNNSLKRQSLSEENESGLQAIENESPQGSKKIKRRNVSIYSACDEN